jgi:hypothetical protein
MLKLSLTLLSGSAVKTVYELIKESVYLGALAARLDCAPSPLPNVPLSMAALK